MRSSQEGTKEQTKEGVRTDINIYDILRSQCSIVNLPPRYLLRRSTGVTKDSVPPIRCGHGKTEFDGVLGI